MMNEAQKRAWSALGLGPLWLPRGTPEEPPGTAQAPDTPGTPASGLVAAEGDRGTAHAGDGRSQRVFCVPDETGGWLFVGEAVPESGAESAVPAPAGRLLERMLAALDLAASADAFVVDFAATGDRRQRLTERIERRTPRVIVALGAFAAHVLLGTDGALPALRGRVHACRLGAHEVPLVVTWHPAELLRAPLEKAGAWADLCRARAALEAAED